MPPDHNPTLIMMIYYFGCSIHNAISEVWLACTEQNIRSLFSMIVIYHFLPTIRELFEIHYLSHVNTLSTWKILKTVLHKTLQNGTRLGPADLKKSLDRANRKKVPIPGPGRQWLLLLLPLWRPLRAPLLLARVAGKMAAEFGNIPKKAPQVHWAQANVKILCECLYKRYELRAIL